MSQPDVDTIKVFSRRSDGIVMGITLGFAMFGALTEIGAGVLNAVFKTNGAISMFWGIWIPMCFMTIPLIHYLCRRMQAMQTRIEDLERRLSSASPHDSDSK